MYLDGLETSPILKEMHLGGGTPTFFSPAHLERLVNTISQSITLADEYSFSFEAHPNSTSSEHLQTLFNAGFQRISIGVQDVSANILKAINRFQTEEQVEEVTLSAREIGYSSINYDIIYGLPFQTIENIDNTMAFIEKMRPDRIAFYSYAHVPWKSKGQRAFTDEDVPYGITKQALKERGELALENMGYLPIGMDHYALPTDSLSVAHQSGKMHRNFMGYTDQYSQSMIGLGASSISDSWSMFVQNEKKIEDYQKSIKAGILPIYCGHELNVDEKETRQKMLDLICRDQMNWTSGGITATIIKNNMDQLQEMQKDGLLKVSSSSIEVTPLGQKLIRNICSAIDPKLQNETAEMRFSQAI
jgi:oxygen-independent coproporphyrinogen-3 oxidase